MEKKHSNAKQLIQLCLCYPVVQGHEDKVLSGGPSSGCNRQDTESRVRYDLNCLHKNRRTKATQCRADGPTAKGLGALVTIIVAKNSVSRIDCT